MSNIPSGFSTFDDTASKEYVVSTSRIRDLYGACLLKETDFGEEGLICNYSVGESLGGRAVFSAERLNEVRKEIGMIVEQLANIDNAPMYSTLGYTKDGRRWATDEEDIEILLQLGSASNMLVLLFPSFAWTKTGLEPMVCRQIYDETTKISGQDRKTFKK